MSKRRISIFIQFTGMSIAAVIFVVTMCGYPGIVVEQFDKISQITEESLGINNSQTNFAEFVSDIQETLADDDATVMSVTGINQHNLQAADDEWETLYKCADEVQGK